MVRKAYEYEEVEFPNRIYFWNHNRYEMYSVNDEYVTDTFNTKNVKRKYKLDRINEDKSEDRFAKPVYQANKVCPVV